MTPLPFPIKVDHREPDDMRLELEACGFVVDVKNNQPIDYIYNDIAISRKTCEDFAATLFDPKRDLFEEMDMMYDYPHKFLLIEGCWGEVFLQSSNIQNTMHSITGALASLIVRNGLKIIPSDDIAMSAYSIDRVCRKADENYQGPEFKPLRTAKKARMTDEEIAMSILMAVPGIGKKTAAKILDEYGSVAGWLNSSGDPKTRLFRLVVG
jgi:ERCC4-type nuclease